MLIFYHLFITYLIFKMLKNSKLTLNIFSDKQDPKDIVICIEKFFQCINQAN